MIKRLSVKLIGLATVALLCKPVIGQEASFLTQKLMLENDIRNKITEALSKIIDEQKYVIDVSIDLELSSEVLEQITVAPATDATRTGRLDDLTSAVEEAASQLERGGTFDNYLPIPGFEFEMSGPSQENAVPVEAEEVPKATMENGDKILSRVLTDKRFSIASIRKMDISLILQEGAAPELIENIRQIVMVASRFNRARGDAMSIMTASFKERRDQRSAEAILLKSIADKVEAMEKQRQTEAVTAEKDWRQELEDYKQEEAQRREKDRTYFDSELAKIEMAARTRAFEQEKRDILQRDSLRLISLNQEIQTLRSQISSATLSEPEAQATQSRVAQIEGERSALDAQISEKIATLESIQTELDKRQSGMNNLPLYLMGMLTFLSVIALVIVLIMTNRTKPRYAPPPPWMQQQRPRKKKRVPKKALSAEEPAPQPVAPVAQPTPVATSPPPPVAEDPGVMRSEINDMRKAVVSMSVGQPETATRIVREWMQEEAPPEPAESEAAPEEEPEETKGKKKKK